MQCYPTPKEFKSLLQVEPLDGIVERFLFTGIPYVFRDSPEREDLLKRYLARSLKVQQDSIIVVGSGRIGFSLSPDTFSRPFGERSDIDVLIYDQNLFDRVWMSLLRWHYPKRYVELYGADKKRYFDRMQEIFWGWLKPDKISFDSLSLPKSLKFVRELGTAWFNSFQSLSQHQEFAGRKVSGRLYRSLEYAQLYHIEGLRQIKASLTEEKRG